jgi:hypothetical protein
VATYVISATQTLSISVAAKFLFTKFSAGADLLARRVVPLFLPRMQPSISHKPRYSFPGASSTKGLHFSADSQRAISLAAALVDLPTPVCGKFCPS